MQYLIVLCAVLATCWASPVWPEGHKEDLHHHHHHEEHHPEEHEHHLASGYGVTETPEVAAVASQHAEAHRFIKSLQPEEHEVQHEEGLEEGGAPIHEHIGASAVGEEFEHAPVHHEYPIGATGAAVAAEVGEAHPFHHGAEWGRAGAAAAPHHIFAHHYYYPYNAIPFYPQFEGQQIGGQYAAPFVPDYAHHHIGGEGVHGVEHHFEEGHHYPVVEHHHDAEFNHHHGGAEFHPEESHFHHEDDPSKVYAATVAHLDALKSAYKAHLDLHEATHHAEHAHHGEHVE